MLRPENDMDKFTTLAARVIARIAGFYGTSFADTLAVCGAAASTALDGPDVLTLEKIRSVLLFVCSDGIFSFYACFGVRWCRRFTLPPPPPPPPRIH